MSLRTLLESLNVSNFAGDCLENMARGAKLRPKSKRKADLIEALLVFYSDPENIIAVWKQLKPYERALLEILVRSDNLIDEGDIEEIFEQFNRKLKQYWNLASLFERQSLAHLLLINGRIPQPFIKVIKPLLKMGRVEIRGVPEPDLNEPGCIELSGNDFESDIFNVISLVNTTTLGVTKSGQVPTKSAMVKLNAVLSTPDTLEPPYKWASPIERIEQTPRLYPLFRILSEGDLIVSDGNNLVLGARVDGFLQANQLERCRMMLEAYLDCTEGWEFDGIKVEKIRVTLNGHSLRSSRELVLKYLRYCPLGEWVDAQELITAIRKNDRRVLPKGLTLDVYHSYHSYWAETATWDMREQIFLETALLGYCTSLGLIDVVYFFAYNDYGQAYYIPTFLRLTPLGAHVLGTNPDYQIPALGAEQAGIIVQPNFEIIVPSGGNQMRHAIEIERFAERIGEGVTLLFRLTFKSMAKALDQGISPFDVKEYLLEHSDHPVPTNVLTTIEDWESKSQKLTIRTITVLETSDPHLLAELQSYKGIAKEVKKELAHAVEIHREGANRIKKQCEQWNYFCLLHEK